MNEFKVTNSLDGEISKLKTSGNLLNHDYSSTGTDDLSLKCCDLYVQQENDIRKLLELYKALVVKDADDLAKMAKTARDMDQRLADYRS